MDTKESMKATKDSIQATKDGFEKSFAENAFYNKQTQDEAHLKMILDKISLQPEMRVLDVGTGSGYLAFAMAKGCQKADINGLDIVEKTLQENEKRAVSEKIHNIKFQRYDGVKFPYEDNEFDQLTTRYALHHFPMLADSFMEMSRVLKKDGKLFISDPTPNEGDDGFVDEYMQMKKDGHIKFYTLEEFKSFGENAGLELIDYFYTTITFPKKKADASDLDAIIARHDPKVVEGYHLDIKESEIYITEKVLNVTFGKR